MELALSPATATDDAEAARSVREAVPRSGGHWYLIGDIVCARAGVPHQLIHWRRAQGEDDPDPML